MTEHDDITTTDLARFGSRERALLIELLTAWQDEGLPEDFDNDEVRPMLNTQSASVFLTNADYAVAMMNGDQLESFYSTPYEGREGFWSELVAEYDEMHPQDREYLAEIAAGRPLPVAYGTQSSCETCGMDIEYHGPDAGWIGRGSDRYCDESGAAGPLPHELHAPADAAS